MPQGTETHFSVIMPVVFGLQHRIGKNERGIGKVYPVIVEVLAPFLFTPFEAYAVILYDCIYIVKRMHSMGREEFASTRDSRTP
jgi:hypothetical protein